MVEPISLGIAIGFLVKSAPGWFHTLQDTLLSKGKEFAIEQSKQRVIGFIDEKKHLRNMEIALQNAAERGLKNFEARAERDQYRSVLEILSEANSEALRQEAMHLFTLSDNPDLTELTERYNLRQRISALAQHKTHEEVDATPYLSSFFEALIAELYNDSLFRQQMSDVIKVRAALAGQRTWEDMRTILSQIYNTLADDYTEEQFQQEVETYLEYVEMKFRRHNFTGIVFRGDEDKAPDLENIFVPLHITSGNHSTPQDKVQDNINSMFELSTYLVLLGGPGSGKSTLTRYIAWSHAKANLTPSSVPITKNPVLLLGKPIPLRIELRLLSEARKKHNGGFLFYATEVMLREEDIFIHVQMFMELLERKMMLVLFDGLDEVPTLSERGQLIEQIEKFAQRYPGNHVMVTSRPVGYEIARFTDPWFIHSEIQEFNNEQIQAFLEGWYTYVLKFPFLTGEVRRELDIFYTTLQNNSRLHKLAANPLLLIVMAALHRYKRLPDKRVELYAECAELLLDTWARLKYKETRWKDMKMGKTNQRDCIAHLGLFLHARSQEHEESDTDTSKKSRQSADDAATDVPSEDIQREIEHFLKSENLLSGAEINAEAERFLDLVKTEAGLIVERGTDERGPLYDFVHRTFQEYFAAVAVIEQSKQEDAPSIISDFLKEHLHNPHWNEVILLLIGQLRHKQVTALLRRLLKGEIKSRRSAYTDIVRQDLFFICTCLTEEILVEQDFVEGVVFGLGDLVKHSPIPLQREEALNALTSLMMTKQYGDLGRKELVALVTQDTIQDVDVKIQAAQKLYRNSSTESEEQQQAAQALLNLVHHIGLSSEQVQRFVWDLYKSSYNKPEARHEATQLLLKLIQSPDLPVNLTVRIAHEFGEVAGEYHLAIPDELRQVMQVLLELAQLPDLSLKQKVQVIEQAMKVAGVFYLIKSPEDELKERQQAVELLLNLTQLPDFSFEQTLQVAQTLYQSSPRMSKEKEQASQILSDLIGQPNLSIEQVLQVAQILYQSSYKDWGNEQLASHALLALAQGRNLSFEQTLQVAQTLYNNSVSDQEIKQQAAQMLLTLTQLPDISFEQTLQVAQTLYNNSVSDREIKQQATQMLLALTQLPDLPFEQTLQVAQAFCENSSSKSEEYQRAVQIFLDLVNKPDFSFEQQVQVAAHLYQYSSKNSQEERIAMRKLLQLAQDPSYTIEHRLQATKAPLAGKKDNYQDILQAVQMVLAMIQSEAAKQYFAEYWRSQYPFINVRSSDISFLVDLIKREILPGKICDQLYRQLRDMVPQFDKINEPAE